MTKLLISSAMITFAGCATAPVATTTTPSARYQVASQAASAEPEVYHTRYYDQQGSTHDVGTEVSPNGDQEIIHDDVLVWGPDHHYSDPD